MEALKEKLLRDTAKVQEYSDAMADEPKTSFLFKALASRKKALEKDIETNGSMLQSIREANEDPLPKFLKRKATLQAQMNVLSEEIEAHAGQKADRMIATFLAKRNQKKEIERKMEAETAKQQSRVVKKLEDSFTEELMKSLNDDSIGEEKLLYLNKARSNSKNLGHSIESNFGIEVFDTMEEANNANNGLKCRFEECSQVFSLRNPQNRLRHEHSGGLHRGMRKICRD